MSIHDEKAGAISQFNQQSVKITVRRAAIFDMLMATIEAAVVPQALFAQSVEKKLASDRFTRSHPHFTMAYPPSLLFGEEGLPVAGILFGQEVGDLECAEFVVERMFTSSTNRSPINATLSPIAPEIMATVIAQAGQSMEVIGDFFSRPRLVQTPEEIERDRSFQWRRDRLTQPEFAGDTVSLQMTITRAANSSPAISRVDKSVVRFDFCEWRIWLGSMLRDRRVPTQGPVLLVEF